MNPLRQYVDQFAPGAQGGNTLLALLPWVLVALAGAWCGGIAVGLAKDAEIARLEKTHADAQRRAALEARIRLEQSIRRGNQLTADLQAAQAAATALEEKLDDALRRQTSGRPCLGSAALRVLDRAPGIAAPVPAPAGLADAAHAGNAAADPAPEEGEGEGDGDTWASDTDLALWSRDAAGRYAECVRRYHALIDFNLQETP